MNIFLDDDRKYRPTPPQHYRFDTGDDLIHFFKQHPNLPIEGISFDYDLGHRLNGYDVVKYMVDHQISAQSYNMHSANTIAKEHMVRYLKSAMQNQIIPVAPITTDDLKHYQERFQK